ncbi:MAG: hypothetical protein ACP5XB_12400 [Isosphaeraceae bacterium]
MKIRYEQAVYGSFPFWERGYGVLAQSAGCRAEWVDALRLAGQRFGERPTGVAEHACIFALPLPRSAWMIVGVFPAGLDDQGRPGALVFHGLFLSRWMYFRAGWNPFALAAALKGHWSEADVNVTLPPGALVVPVWRWKTGRNVGPADPRIIRIVMALKEKRRVLIASAEPINDLAQAVWEALPGSVRRRASVATWAFGNDNGFDLVAIPRLPALAPDSRDLFLEPGN